MENRPVTTIFLTGLGLWGLWLWRRHRLELTAATGAPRPAQQSAAPFDAGARLAEVTL